MIIMSFLAPITALFPGLESLAVNEIDPVLSPVILTIKALAGALEKISLRKFV
jgi:hypothetical protein